MSLFCKSLDGATSVGPGKVIHFDIPRSVTLQVFTEDQGQSGGGSASVLLEGSLDGVNFVTIHGIGAEIGPDSTNLFIDQSSLRVLSARANCTAILPPTAVTALIVGHVEE